MNPIYKESYSSENIENVNGAKLIYRSIHHLCRNDKHRCCEFVVELHPDSVGNFKFNLLIFLSIISIIYSLITEKNDIILYISFCVLCIIFLKQSSVILKESVLIEMDMIGIQQTRTNYFGFQTSEVLHKNDVQDIVINEIITMNAVIFYLAVIMKDNSIKPLYKYLLPRLKCLNYIYQEMQDTLWTHTTENT